MAGRKILLVEGKDDLHVFRALLGRRNLPLLSEIKDHEGWTQLLEALPVRLKESDVHAVGIVLDADTSLAARWDAISHRLSTAGYSPPPQPDPQGLVSTRRRTPFCRGSVSGSCQTMNCRADSKISCATLSRKGTRFSPTPKRPWTTFQETSACFSPLINPRPSFTPGLPGRRNPADPLALPSRLAFLTLVQPQLTSLSAGAAAVRFLTRSGLRIALIAACDIYTKRD